MMGVAGSRKGTSPSCPLAGGRQPDGPWLLRCMWRDLGKHRAGWPRETSPERPYHQLHVVAESGRGGGRLVISVYPSAEPMGGLGRWTVGAGGQEGRRRRRRSDRRRGASVRLMGY